jgi:hypothetical protein
MIGGHAGVFQWVTEGHDADGRMIGGHYPIALCMRDRT